jgi:hypothetical protein
VVSARTRTLLEEVRDAAATDAVSRAPPTPLGDVLPDRLARVVARIVAPAGPPAVSPATGARAAWFRTQCMMQSCDGAIARTRRAPWDWDLVFDETFGEGLVIEDASGRAVVLSLGAHVAVELRDVTELFAKSRGGDELRLHFEQRSVPFDWSGVLVLEGALHEGDVIEVVGRASLQRAEAGGYRAAAAAVNVFGTGSADGAAVRIRKIED